MIADKVSPWAGIPAVRLPWPLLLTTQPPPKKTPKTSVFHWMDQKSLASLCFVFLLVWSKRIHLEDLCYLCLAWVRGKGMENCLDAAFLALQNRQLSMRVCGRMRWRVGRDRGKRGNSVSEWDVWQAAEFSDLARPGKALALKYRKWAEGWKDRKQR